MEVEKMFSLSSKIVDREICESVLFNSLELQPYISMIFILDFDFYTSPVSSVSQKNGIRV